MKKNKKKGFTLIELLAVIVILGLLIAIAVPSVSKYITESRKKTLTSTISNYVGAVLNEVNNMEYTFTSDNTIYAVPIECISLERGGTNPFGKWHQSNSEYFAYVLVQYDDLTSSYVYGYTFKDSAGYGLYPITQAKLNVNGKQIKTGLDLSQPQTGKLTTVTSLDKWDESGFKVNATTDLVVLEAETEGVLGDGKTTCTLAQKGANYEQIESEKETEPVLVCVPATGDDLVYTYGKDTWDDVQQMWTLPSITATYTTGKKAIGDAYRCTVGENISYVFNILEIKDDTVSLIMNKNIDDEQVMWCGDSSQCMDGNGNWTTSKGPLTANETLINKTSGWNNENILSIDLPSYDQIYNINNSTTLGDVTWLYGNLRSDSYPSYLVGYWTKTESIQEGNALAYEVGNYGLMGMLPSYVGVPVGIRPVITISSENI